MSLGNYAPQRRRNPSNNTLTLVILAAGGYYAYTQGWLDSLLGKTTTPPGGGGGGGGGTTCTGASEDAAALKIGRSTARPDLCANITAWSAGAYNCSSDAQTITLVKHWWNTMNPPEKAQYGTLCAYAAHLGL